jgi:hypothetical protein
VSDSKTAKAFNDYIEQVADQRSTANKVLDSLKLLQMDQTQVYLMKRFGAERLTSHRK